MRPDRLSLLVRVLTVIAGLLLAGIVLRLLVAVLEPVLPVFLMGGLAAGWSTLLTIVNPAMGPIMALAILAVICWIVVGRQR